MALPFPTWATQCCPVPVFSTIQSHPTHIKYNSYTGGKMVIFELMAFEVDICNRKILFKQTSQKKTNMQLSLRKTEQRTEDYLQTELNK